MWTLRKQPAQTLVAAAPPAPPPPPPTSGFYLDEPAMLHSLQGCARFSGWYISGDATNPDLWLYVDEIGRAHV